MKEKANDEIMCPVHTELHPIYIAFGGIMGAMAKDSCLNLARTNDVCVKEVIKNYSFYINLKNKNKLNK